MITFLFILHETVIFILVLDVTTDHFCKKNTDEVIQKVQHSSFQIGNSTQVMIHEREKLRVRNRLY